MTTVGSIGIKAVSAFDSFEATVKANREAKEREFLFQVRSNALGEARRLVGEFGYAEDVDDIVDVARDVERYFLEG